MSIELVGLHKRYATVGVVEDVTLEVTDGELFVLLGPSGSGKSTVLRMIAGLVHPDRGRVKLHGRDVTALPPQQRNVGMVFQNYSLFRNMTVARNIEFGLEVRRVPGPERRRRRDELLDLIGMSGLADRFPRQLSGGQAQRVAVARALAFDPSVLLLDEPFGALDVRIRGQLRRSLKEIQRRLGVTTILVTHDQDEAFELADRIGVIDQGRLLEVGSPEELYRHPCTEFVARFLGNATLLHGRLDGLRLSLGALELDAAHVPGVGAGRVVPDRSVGSGVVAVMLRPEDLEVAVDREALRAPLLGRATITSVDFRGSLTRVEAALEPLPGVRALAAGFGEPLIPMEVSVLPAELERQALGCGTAAWLGIRNFHVLARTALRIHLTVHGAFEPADLTAVARNLCRMENLEVDVLVVAASADRLEERVAAVSKAVPAECAWTMRHAIAEDWSAATLAAARVEPYDMLVTRADSSGAVERLARLAPVSVLFLRGTRPSLSRALVCTAAGEPGKVDVMVAARVARRLHAEATLLHVASTAGEASPSDLAVRHLAQGAETLRAQGVAATTRLRHGDVVREVLSEAAEGGYDLIVVGGHLPAARLALGQRDLATAIATASGCSVLVVRGTLS